MADYFIEIRVGDHSWSIEHSRDKIPDALEVLAGLQFGWSLPSGTGPMQPNVMTASLALNVPSFPSVNDIELGQPVAIEIRFDPTDDLPWAAFYGRVSDVSASPRRGTIAGGRPGVTLSIAAVDYTVDLTDLESWAPDDAPQATAKGYVEVFDELWTDRLLGTLPAWPIGFNSSGPTVGIGESPVEAAALIKDILVVSVSDDATKRIILAPTVAGSDFDGWSFDVIEKAPSSTPWVLHGAYLTRSDTKWVKGRRSVPGNTIEVSGTSDAAPPVYFSEATIGQKVITERLSTIGSDHDELENVAEFYLNPGDDNTWTLDVSVLLTQTLTQTQLNALPGDLFPQWKADVGDPLRAGCYGKRVDIETVPPTEHPFGIGYDITGRLGAVSVTVTGGQVRLAATLRRAQNLGHFGP